jgi:antitoxin (DNA-binding transcriptional repressor) of toxin-antitoxin stability system
MAEHREEARAPDVNQLTQEAITDQTVPDIHFNGFVNGIGQGDVLIVLTRHGRPVAKLSASYTVAKTLAQKLGQVIAHLELQTGNTIMTVDDIEKALHKGEEGNASHPH